MIRTALRPRWLAWLVIALAAVYVCLRLGLWQLGVARDDAARDALVESQARPTAPLSSVLRPHQPWDGRVLSNRRVTMTGSYDPSGQFLVADRRLDGRPGFWVVTPLRTTEPQGVIAAVRGWVAQPSAPPVPRGQCTLTGTLAQGESAATGTSATLPAGQYGSIDLARLVNQWQGDLYNAFVFVSDEQPDAAAGLTRVPPPQPESGLNARNAAYAVQWWVFGLFCPVLWWRMVAAAHRAAPDGETDDDPREPDDREPGDHDPDHDPDRAEPAERIDPPTDTEQGA